MGVDDGPSARSAVVWAARAASRRRVPLVVCHAYQSSDARTDLELSGAARNRAWRTARYGVEMAQAEVPGVQAVPWVGEGSTAQVLVNAVKRPEFIVVGFRTHGQLAAELLATFCGWADALEPCPVVAVPARSGARRRLSPGRRGTAHRRHGQIVVASAGGQGHDAVVRFATTEAALLGDRVVETPVPGFDLELSDPGDSLAILAKDADLLVVGKPVDSAPERLRTPAREAGCVVDLPSVTLGAALGFGEFRHLGTPVAVVPVGSAEDESAGRRGAVRCGVAMGGPKKFATAGGVRVPAARKVSANAEGSRTATGVAAARIWARGSRSHASGGGALSAGQPAAGTTVEGPREGGRTRARREVLDGHQGLPLGRS